MSEWHVPYEAACMLMHILRHNEGRFKCLLFYFDPFLKYGSYLIHSGQWIKCTGYNDTCNNTSIFMFIEIQRLSMFYDL